jgi:hypothetical protein
VSSCSASVTAIVPAQVLGRTAYEVAYLVIRRLREVVVPEADGPKRTRRHVAHDLVDDVAKLVARLLRGNRDGDDEPRRVEPEDGERRAWSRP